MEQNETTTDQPKLELRFADSFAHNITAALGIMAAASKYEGFDQWVYVAFAALPDALRQDILTVFNPVGLSLIFERLTAENPRIEDFPAFIGWLSVIDEQSVRETVSRIFRSLARKASKDGKTQIAVPALGDSTAVHRFLQRTAPDWTKSSRGEEDSFDELVRLLTNPQQLKERLVYTITRFWETVYKKEYEATRGRIKRSIAYHRQARYPEAFTEIHLAVTGKSISPAFEEAYAELETLVFVPSCHAGPYVQFIPIDEERRALVLIFSARTHSGNEDHPLSSIGSIFPPLKALADETRLEILGILADGELYAQQIVDRLEISQPAVSRHLRLMVAGGILKERREVGMKFYRIRQETLTELAKRMAAFVAWGSD